MFINGSNDDDFIRGTNSRDIIFGNKGDDIILGRGGNDDLTGGRGDDQIEGGSGQDFIWGKWGVNDLFGGSGADNFIMSPRRLGSSDDWIGDFQFDVDEIDVTDWGVSDFSQLQALFRTDAFGDAFLNAFYNGENHFLTISGVAANELIVRDFIYADPGRLNETGTDNKDVMFGSRAADTLDGAGGRDILLGGLGRDTLFGGTGDDDLIGGKHDDKLEGEAGQDRLTGDAGEDIFVFRNESDSPDSGGADFITDFDEGGDLIRLRNIDADSTTAGDQDFTFIGGAAFSAAGQVRVETGGNNTFVYGNTDADLAAEFRIVLRGTDALNAGDFIL